MLGVWSLPCDVRSEVLALLRQLTHGRRPSLRGPLLSLLHRWLAHVGVTRGSRSVGGDSKSAPSPFQSQEPIPNPRRHAFFTRLEHMRAAYFSKCSGAVMHSSTIDARLRQLWQQAKSMDNASAFPIPRRAVRTQVFVSGSPCEAEGHVGEKIWTPLHGSCRRSPVVEEEKRRGRGEGGGLLSEQSRKWPQLPLSLASSPAQGSMPPFLLLHPPSLGPPVTTATRQHRNACSSWLLLHKRSNAAKPSLATSFEICDVRPCHRSSEIGATRQASRVVWLVGWQRLSYHRCTTEAYKI